MRTLQAVFSFRNRHPRRRPGRAHLQPRTSTHRARTPPSSHFPPSIRNAAGVSRSGGCSTTLCRLGEPWRALPRSDDKQHPRRDLQHPFHNRLPKRQAPAPLHHDLANYLVRIANLRNLKTTFPSAHSPPYHYDEQLCPSVSRICCARQEFVTSPLPPPLPGHATELQVLLLVPRRCLAQNDDGCF